MRVLVALTVLALALQADAWSDDRTWHRAPKYTLNLDLPQNDRWTAIIADFKPQAPQILEYLESQIPRWAMPIIQTVAKDIRPYFKDYADEMLGIAVAYGLPVGDVVAVNLIYQLESLGLNCSNWNVTAPTSKDDPGCVDVDPKQDWCYCKDDREYIDPHTSILQPPKYRGPNVTGLCTSVVANMPGGSVVHGRNLDWNIPSVLRKLVIDVDFQSEGKTVFTGTTIAGFVGVLNGMQPGADGWSVSLDARGKGGHLLANIAQALLHKSMTPTQHIRKSLETTCSYTEGVERLGQQDLVDEGYFIVAGAESYAGGVMSRERNSQGDYWPMNVSDPDGWFRLQTNYDHWNPVPKADDRRTPGVVHMKALGQANVSSESIMRIMRTYPTYNFHTDYTAVMIPHVGLYDSGVWL